MFKDCYAFYDENTGFIKLGNSKIEKVLQVKGTAVRTACVRDTATDFDWSGNSLWQRCPVFDEGETPAVSFDTEIIENPYGMKPHPKAVLCIRGDNGTAWYEYLIFPEVAFIYNQNFASKQGNIEVLEQENKSNAPTGIEQEQNKAEANSINFDVLDCVPLGSRHLNVNSFKLYDKTDYNDMLVEQQNATVYTFRNGELKRDGNVFCINDYVGGNSLMMIKHSPTESSALNRKGPDFAMQGNVYATL